MKPSSFARSARVSSPGCHRGEIPQAQDDLAPFVRCAGEHQERRAKDLMVASLNEDISLLRLAAECGLSARHFARAFRQSTGLSPHRWLIQYRVERARELVADRRLSLIEIALICGFADQSHFTRAFTAIVAPQRQRPRLEEVAAGWAQFLAKASP